MKLFTGNGDVTLLEGEVNRWLDENPYITIKEIGQSYVSSGGEFFTLMSVWYDS